MKYLYLDLISYWSFCPLYAEFVILPLDGNTYTAPVAIIFIARLKENKVNIFYIWCSTADIHLKPINYLHSQKVTHFQ